MPGLRGEASPHGGAGALKARQQGKPFAGLAAERAQEIGLQLEQSGPDGFIKRDAKQLQTIADLYFDAILAASERGDQDKVDSYVKTWGWLVSSALRAMLEVRKLPQQDDKAEQARIIELYRHDTIQQATVYQVDTQSQERTVANE